MDEKVTEANYVNLEATYGLTRHGDMLAERASRCPYDFGDIEEAKMAAHMWALYTAVNPDTGVAVLVEFANEMVEDERLAAKIRRSASIVHGEFEVMTSGRNGNVWLKKLDGGAKYRVICGVNVGPNLTKGMRIETMLHPWEEDGTHKLCGTVKVTREQVNTLYDSNYFLDSEKFHQAYMQEIQDKAESISLTPRSKVAPVLKKYPSEWSTAICARLNIDCSGVKHRDRCKAIADVLVSDRMRDILDGLDRKERACLQHIVGEGGFFGYDAAQDRFGADDTTLDWSGKPRSVIGSLRRTGIVLVGVRWVGDEGQRVTAIAADVLANLMCMEDENVEKQRSGWRFWKQGPE